MIKRQINRKTKRQKTGNMDNKNPAKVSINSQTGIIRMSVCEQQNRSMHLTAPCQNGAELPLFRLRASRWALICHKYILQEGSC